MSAIPKLPELEQKADISGDKQKNRIISTYEITSLLGNYQKGVVSKENGILLLMSMGRSHEEAETMLNNTEVIGDNNE